MSFICERCGDEHDGSYGSGRYCSKKYAIKIKQPKKICKKCEKEISLSNFNTHFNSCDGKCPKNNKIKEEWKQENGLYKCPYCEKEFCRKGIWNHIWRNHTEEGKKFSPNEGYKNGRIVWNKGLTKENDKRVEKYGNTFSENYNNGKFKHPFSGKHLSKEHKKSVSNGMKIDLLLSISRSLNLKFYDQNNNEITVLDLYNIILKNNYLDTIKEIKK